MSSVIAAAQNILHKYTKETLIRHKPEKKKKHTHTKKMV